MEFKDNEHKYLADLIITGFKASKEYTDAKIAELVEFLIQIFNKVPERSEMNAGFNQVNIRLDKVELRLDGVELRLDNIEQKIDHIDNHEQRITKLEEQC